MGEATALIHRAPKIQVNSFKHFQYNKLNSGGDGTMRNNTHNGNTNNFSSTPPSSCEDPENCSNSNGPESSENQTTPNKAADNTESNVAVAQAGGGFSLTVISLI